MQICSDELGSDGECFQSIWTLDSKQITDLNDIEEDCGILLVSHLPMMFVKPSNLKARRKVGDVSKVLNELPLQGAAAVQQETKGLKGNQFVVNSWKDFYQLSIKRTESGLKSAKDSWFRTEYGSWIESNAHRLENAHLVNERLSQTNDPRTTTQYLRKEKDPKDDKLTGTLDNGTFWQKEKFKFKDF